MGIGFVTGVKVTAAFSMIFSLIMLGGTSWIFGTQMADLDEKLNSSGLHYPNRSSISKHPHYRNDDRKNYTDVLNNLKSIWHKNQPILVTCSAIAVVVGFIQLTLSVLIISSNAKNIRKRMRSWLITHFMIFLTLIVCLLSAFLVRMNHGLHMESWSEILESLHKILHKLEPNNDYSSLFAFLEVGLPLYYGVVGSNILATFILFGIGIYFMHKYNDYEPQE